VGGRSFHDREEIIALRNAVTAIEWPDDELKVFAILRGPFFAFGDEALLAFRQYVDGDGALKTRRPNPMHTIERTALDPTALEVADALDPELVHIEETDANFTIEWKGHYRIEGDAFIYVDRKTGGTRAILGYPTQKLEQAARSS
jgi:hypothetical protein